MLGRKRDAIWSEFNEISQGRVKCLHCNDEFSTKAFPMKKNFEEKHTNITIKTSRQGETFVQSTNMDKFVVRTTPDMTKSERRQATDFEEEFPNAHADFLNFIGGDSVQVKEAYAKFDEQNKPNTTEHLRKPTKHSYESE